MRSSRSDRGRDANSAAIWCSRDCGGVRRRVCPSVTGGQEPLWAYGGALFGKRLASFGVILKGHDAFRFSPEAS